VCGVPLPLVKNFSIIANEDGGLQNFAIVVTMAKVTKMENNVENLNFFSF
jgi:hypothetical protein